MSECVPLEKIGEHFRVRPGQSVRLADRPTDERLGWDRADARKAVKALRKELEQQQELLAANDTDAVLLVFQAMDAGGKDSTIRGLGRGLCVAEATVAAFKKPTPEELSHDYLWRIHRRVPPLGKIGIFNRSHYEDVLVVRVKQLVPENIWQARYEEINQFEARLGVARVHIIKFFLHISKAYQTERLQRRLDLPSKHWKLTEADLRERDRWEDYQEAYEAVLNRCSTAAAPWYVIPAEKRWLRNLAVTQIVVARLKSLGLHYPAPTVDPDTITLD